MEKTDKLFDAIRELSRAGRTLDEITHALDSRFGEDCAVLVLDSTGFTRVTKAFGTVYFLSIIQRMRDTCVPIFTENDVVDWRAFADNLFAEFRTADAALNAALSIHRFFEENPIPLTNAEDLFGACIGIGYGRVLRSKNEGVYGDEMNLAAKLGEDTAKRGETLLTHAAYGAISHPESFSIEQRRLAISGVNVPIYRVFPIST